MYTQKEGKMLGQVMDKNLLPNQVMEWKPT